MKNEKATWIPPLKAAQKAGTNNHGWMNLDGEIWEVTNLHHYDDFGREMETFTIEKDGMAMELYSYDEGETFHDEE